MRVLAEFDPIGIGALLTGAALGAGGFVALIVLIFVVSDWRETKRMNRYPSGGERIKPNVVWGW